ncbi:MAG: metallophosphoesterase family protein [Planctomycetota bacterium]
MRTVTALVIFVLTAVLSGCGRSDVKIDVSEKANPWTHLDFYNNAENFQFAVISDRTGRPVPGVYENAISKLNLLNPEFVVCVGDLIQGGSQNADKINLEWDEFDSIVGEFEMPFFYLPGNHDINNKVKAKVWRERLGRSYYHFVYRDVLFLCLSTDEEPETTQLSDSQLDYFQKVMNDNSTVRWVLVFMHKPMWEFEGKDGVRAQKWAKFESILAGKDFTVFAGHKHRYVMTERDGRKYYVLSMVNQRGNQNADQCRFNHVMWVTMTDEGPEVANIMLDGILGDEACPKEAQSER